jgi:outer membrane protein OmpA-like peptidoglycan-associated protein
MVFMNDGKTGYFSSNRTGGKGSDDIYYFDMGNDKDLVTSIYVIGYKKPPPPPPVVVAPPPKVDTVKALAPPPLPPPSIDLHINFDVDKATLRPDATAKLNEIVAYLQKNTGQMVQINGYTDISGQEEYNQMLSNQRANAAAQYVIGKGIDKNRVRTVGYGPHPPLLTEGVYDRVKEEVNRRVQFEMLPLNSTEAKTPAPSAPIFAAPIFAPAGYAIQITATMTEMADNSPDFKGVSGVHHIRYENGYYCYYYGFYPTSVAAAEGLMDLSSKGVNGTIVGLSNKIK